jgi:hypothetical protein
MMHTRQSRPGGPPKQFFCCAGADVSAAGQDPKGRLPPSCLSELSPVSPPVDGGFPADTPGSSAPGGCPGTGANAGPSRPRSPRRSLPASPGRRVPSGTLPRIVSGKELNTMVADNLEFDFEDMLLHCDDRSPHVSGGRPASSDSGDAAWGHGCPIYIENREVGDDDGGEEEDNGGRGRGAGGAGAEGGGGADAGIASRGGCGVDAGQQEQEQETKVGGGGGGGGGGAFDGLAVQDVGDFGDSPSGALAAAPSAEEAPNLFSPGGTRVDSASFDILYMIGQGGFGKVFQVKRKTTGKIYAMKCMRKDCVLRENLRGTKAERSILSSLKHPFIVNMHWAFQCRSRLYIVMDYFPGRRGPRLFRVWGLGFRV